MSFIHRVLFNISVCECIGKSYLFCQCYSFDVSVFHNLPICHLCVNKQTNILSLSIKHPCSLDYSQHKSVWSILFFLYLCLNMKWQGVCERSSNEHISGLQTYSSKKCGAWTFSQIRYQSRIIILRIYALFAFSDHK